MASVEAELRRVTLRNRLVGAWAAEKLALVGDLAEAYAEELADKALDLNREEIVAKIRSDFDAAGVNETDEKILAVVNQAWLAAENKVPNSSNADDAALNQIARNLMK